MAKTVSKKIKLSILAASAALGALAYFSASAHFSKELTRWQLEQKIDFDAGTGSTKFNALVKSVSAAGVVFCISATILATAAKFIGNGK